MSKLFQNQPVSVVEDEDEDVTSYLEAASSEEPKQSLWERLKAFIERIRKTLVGVCSGAETLVNAYETIVEFVKRQYANLKGLAQKVVPFIIAGLLSSFVAILGNSVYALFSQFCPVELEPPLKFAMDIMTTIACYKSAVYATDKYSHHIVEPHVSSGMHDGLMSLLTSLNVKNILLFNAASNALRNVRTVTQFFSWILDIFIPTFVKDIFSAQFPAVADTLALLGTEWAGHNMACRKAIHDLKRDSMNEDTLNQAKQILRAGKQVGSKLILEPYHRNISKTLSDLENAIHDATIKIDIEKGARGYAMWLHGPNQQGKTECSRVLARLASKVFCQLKGLKDPQNRVVVRPRGNFFENLTADHRVVIFNDVGTQEPLDCAQWLSDISGMFDQSYSPNMAAIDKKALSFNVPITICSSNHKTATGTRQDALGRAVAARCCHYTVKMKPRYTSMSQVRELCTKQELRNRNFLDFFPYEVDSAGKEKNEQQPISFLAVIRRMKEDIEQRSTAAANFSLNDEDLDDLLDGYEVPEERESKEYMDEDKPVRDYTKMVATGAALGLVLVGAYKALKWLMKPKKVEPHYISKSRSDKPRVLKVAPHGPGAGIPAEVKKVWSNIVKIRRKSLSEAYLYGTLIDSSSLIVNTHFIDTADPEQQMPEEDEFTIIIRNPNAGADATIVRTIKKKDIINCGGDISLVPIVIAIPGITSLRKLITNVKQVKEGTRVLWLQYDRIVDSWCNGMSGIQYDDSDFQTTALQHRGHSIPGDCGTPLLYDTPNGFRIFGLHCAGVDGLCWATPLPKIPASKFTITTPEFTPVPPHFRMPDTNAIPVGASTRVYSNMNTRMKPTQFLPEREEDMLVAPARMSMGILYERGEKYKKVQPGISSEDIDYAKLVVSRAYIKASPVPRTMMTWEDVYDKICASGTWSHASGYQTKSRESCRNKELDEFTPEFKAHCDALLLDCAEGKAIWPIVVPNLKDEALPMRKVRASKTRIFEVFPFDWLIVGMRLLGNFHNHMLSIQNQSFSKMGMNVDSAEWHVMLSKFLKDGKQFFDCDVSNNDGDQPPWLYEVWTHVLQEFYGHSISIQTYEQTMFSSLMIMGNLVYTRHQGNPSGRVCTTDLNAVAQIAFLAIAFRRIFPRANVSDFFTHIDILCYGDDNVTAVSREAAEKGFGFFRVREELATFGMVITPGTKDAEPENFLPIHKLTFLKRHFLFSEQLMMWVPYIPYENIIAQLTFCRDNSPEGLRNLSLSVSRTYWWRGTWRRAEPNPPGLIDCSTPTYDDLIAEIHRVFGVQLPVWSSLQKDMMVIGDIEYDGPQAKLDWISPWTNPWVPEQQSRPTEIEVIQPTKQPTNNNMIKIQSNQWVMSTPKMDLTMSENMEPILVSPHAAMGVGAALAQTLVKPVIDSVLGAAGNSLQSVTRMDRPGPFQDPTPFKHTAYFNPNNTGDSHTVYLDDEVAKPIVADENTFLVSRDEMSMEFFTSKETLLAQLDVPIAKGPRPLIVVPVTPYYDTWLQVTNGVSQGNAYVPTSLEYRALHNRRWRVDMIYTIRVVMPSLNSVKLLFATKYGINDVTELGPDLESAMASPNITTLFDTNTRVVTFKVPYVSDRDYMFSPAHSMGPKNVFETLIGALEIWQVTDQSTRAGVVYNAPTLLQIYVSAENCQFQDFTWPEVLVPKEFDIVPPVRTPAVMSEETAKETDLEDEILNRSEKWVELPGWFPSQTVRSVEPHMYRGITSGATVNTDESGRSTGTASKVEVAHAVAPIDLTSLAHRFEQLSVLDITAATPTGLLVTWDYPSSFVTQHMVYAIEAAAFWRADLEVRLTVTTSSLNFGQIVVYFQPMDVHFDTTLNPDDEMRRITSLDHALVDLSSTEPITFTIPFRHWGEKWRASSFGVHGAPNTAPIVGRLGLYLTRYGTSTVDPSGVSVLIQRAWPSLTLEAVRSVNATLPPPQIRKVVPHGPAVDRVSYNNTNIPENSAMESLAAATDNTPQMRDAHVEKAPERAAHDEVGGQKDQNPTSFGTQPTSGQPISGTDKRVVYEMIHTIPLKQPDTTPQDLVEYLRRPQFIEAIAAAHGLSTYFPYRGFESPFETLPSVHPMRRLSVPYGLFMGNLTYTVVNAGPSTSTLIGALMPLSGDTTNTVPAQFFTSAATGIINPMGGPPLAIAQTRAPAESSTSFCVPMRPEFRVISTRTSRGELSPGVAPFFILSDEEVPGNCRANFYINFADGARFGWFLGVPTLQFEFFGFQRGQTCDRFVQLPPLRTNTPRTLPGPEPQWTWFKY